MKKPKEIELNPLFDKILSETPKDSKIFVSKSLHIASQIIAIMEKKNILQKDLAQKLGKSEAEISKWLSGTHNFTIRTLSKIEAELGELVITTPKKVAEDFFSTIDKVTSNFNNKTLRVNVSMAVEKEVTGELKAQTTKKECKIISLWQKTQFVESRANQNKKEVLTGTFC